MEFGDAMESGARDALFLCARMNMHFSVGSGSPSCRLDSEPVVTVDSASVEAAAMDHAVITVDAGVGVHLEHPSTTQPKSSLSIVVSCKEHLNIRKSKEKKAGSGSKGTSKWKCQNFTAMLKKFGPRRQIEKVCLSKDNLHCTCNMNT
uniref:Uncharacterized protein n=1 Tax=Oryza glumipatula TaxID=40148 RepID=A0A0E0AA37_9ORYZ